MKEQHRPQRGPKICRKLQWERVRDTLDGKCDQSNQVQALPAPYFTANGEMIPRRPSFVLIRSFGHNLSLDAVFSEVTRHLAGSLVEMPCDVRDIATAGLHGKVCIFLGGGSHHHV